MLPIHGYACRPIAAPPQSRFLFATHALAPSSYCTGSPTSCLSRRREPAMSSEVALRVAYFTLNLVGGLTVTIGFSILCLNFRRTQDGPFLTSIALCLSRIVSTLTSCLL